MFAWGGGVGMVVYGGGRRRLIVSSNIVRTRAVSTDATPASPCALHDDCRPRGSVRAATLAEKQLRVPDPAASARSAQPLPVTMFRVTVFARGRQRGPGSRAVGSKVT